MTDIQKNSIAEMRARGDSYAKISATLSISENTIKSYCRRNKLNGNPSAQAAGVPDSHTYCKLCGKKIIKQPGRKPKKFCSKDCCAKWWTNHPESLNRKAVYSFACAHCGTAFTAYGNKGRKFCSHSCYVVSRFGKGKAR